MNSSKGLYGMGGGDCMIPAVDNGGEERALMCILPEGLWADEARRRLAEVAQETGMRLVPVGAGAQAAIPCDARLVIRRASTGIVVFDGREVLLTPLQFRMLAFLAEHAGEGMPYERIEQVVWDGVIVERQQIGFHRRRLEEKLQGGAREAETLIETHPRWGIRLRLSREQVRFEGGGGMLLRAPARIVPVNFIAREVG
ncbi:winged helix-turn-helix domain-containing protein [Candidatus Sumerlaeota bacterium]|nr:winged helix-turn-helix domain-containing protein [Candidatus Sumerlaeota bacterium]